MLDVLDVLNDLLGPVVGRGQRIKWADGEVWYEGKGMTAICGVLEIIRLRAINTSRLSHIGRAMVSDSGFASNATLPGVSVKKDGSKTRRRERPCARDEE